MEFKHPNYYKNLRKLYRLRDRDQAISDNDSTESRERAPGTGLKHQAVDLKINLKRVRKQYTSSKHQASSDKDQASSVKHQALKLSNQPG